MYRYPCDSDGKESSCNVRDPGSIPGLGRSPGAGSQHTRSYPWQGHEGENLTGKADQVFKDSEKASSRDPTHDKVMGRKPDGQGGSGFQGFQKAAPGAHLKDGICSADTCFNRLLPNFCDTGRRPSQISFQIRINLEL